MTGKKSRDERRRLVHPGRIEDPQVRRTSRERDEHRQELIRRTHEAPRPPLAQLGALVMLLVAAVLLVAQWDLYPTGMTGQDNGLRALGVAVVITLAGCRILFGRPGRHAVAAGLALLAGVWLLLQASLVAHTTVHAVVLEAACGALVVLSAAAALASPDRAIAARGAGQPTSGRPVR